MARRRKARKHPVGLALAGGGPFGAIYDIGALMALQESIEGIDFNDIDVYVGVSAVEIGGHFFVDGALRKRLHASEALDDGARLVICVNPIVPYDADLAAEKGKGRHAKLVEGGLPAVLSQTFRALIHSRMAVGLSKYRTQYHGADVVLFQPDADDSEIFFTKFFSYATRQRVCEHAYARTRRDLLKRRHELEPILARHGMRLRIDVLEDESRRLKPGMGGGRGAPPVAPRLRGTAQDLRETLVDLGRWVDARKARTVA